MTIIIHHCIIVRQIYFQKWTKTRRIRLQSLDIKFPLKIVNFMTHLNSYRRKSLNPNKKKSSILYRMDQIRLTNMLITYQIIMMINTQRCVVSQTTKVLISLISREATSLKMSNNTISLSKRGRLRN